MVLEAPVSTQATNLDFPILMGRWHTLGWPASPSSRRWFERRVLMAGATIFRLPAFPGRRGDEFPLASGHQSERGYCRWTCSSAFPSFTMMPTVKARHRAHS